MSEPYLGIIEATLASDGSVIIYRHIALGKVAGHAEGTGGN